MFLNLMPGLEAKRNIPRPTMEYFVSNKVNPSDQHLLLATLPTHGSYSHRSFPAADTGDNLLTPVSTGNNNN